ncbi:MAG: hypothetical protein J2P32_08240, partial [Actinobacteria bacterium]|nr:hypothetical protein [Actinomycetota bacterium]
PAAGSTDTLDYAAYGRMVVIGHDPYVMTPQQLRGLGDPVGRAAPVPWQRTHSVYGPLATIEQATAAELGGTSAGRIVFWLKLWNALAFGAVVLALDRLLRHDPGRRARAHLLWTVNPLLLWILLAGGHVDALAAAAGFLGLIVAGDWVRAGPGGHGGHGRWRPGPEPGRAPEALRGLTAGALIGAAADLKITFVLFGLGLAWAARRSPRMLLASTAGALAVLVPSYLWFGPPALTVLAGHSTSTGDNLYRVFVPGLGPGSPAWLAPVALALFAAVALLLLRRLPGGYPGLPAVRPALILSLAWLLTWPYQRPWYDAMMLCLLALPAGSRLDWPVLARLTAATFYSVPGIPGRRIHWLHEVTRWSMLAGVPAVRLAALAAVIALCLTAAWYPGQQFRLRLPAWRRRYSLRAIQSISAGQREAQSGGSVRR